MVTILLDFCIFATLFQWQFIFNMNNIKNRSFSVSQIQIRTAIIQQLKDIKSLEEIGVLTKEQFEEQRNKLLNEMSNM